jgi:multiple sugar transport system substrate-binding protein
VGRRNGLMTTLAAVAAVVLLAGCGGGGDDGGGASDATTTARGPITYVQGKDNTNTIRPLLDKWNTAHPDEKITFKEQSDEADQQHDDLVQHFQAKDPEYDVVSVDVVWTAEFAAKGWLHPLKDSFALDTAPLLPATVKTSTYNNTLYAAPVTSDGAMLYYRKDLVPNPPKTWDEMIGMCSIAEKNNLDCYAGQFFKYEGLTCNAAEAINTTGGVIVGADGKTPSVTTPEAAKGLGRLTEAYANGNIPKQAITYTEEESRNSFQSGKLLFLRQWPYVYNLAASEGGSKVKGKFDVAPLPGDSASKPGASALGGHNAGISAYSDHKATALDFLKFLETEESQKWFVTQGSNAPALAALYDDPALIKEQPYLPTLKTSILNAVPRPVTPFYPAVTKAIQDNAYAAIKGDKPVQTALTDMQSAITAAASTG